MISGHPMNVSMSVREIGLSDSDWVRTFLIGHFGSTRVVTRGLMHQADQLPGFAALYDSEPSALLTYCHKADELEVVTLHVATRGVGLGSQLIATARKRARDLRCRRIWLITTNDNEPAIRFYERCGMGIAAIHRGAIAETRKLKPEISFFGIGGADEPMSRTRFGESDTAFLFRLFRTCRR